MRSDATGVSFLECGSVSLRRVQARAQSQDRFGVELTDARLGHAEHRADLLEGEAFVVVEGDDDLLTLGQTLDRSREDLFDLGALEDLDRVLGGIILDARDGAVLVVAVLPAGPQFLERDDRCVREFGPRLLQHPTARA
jgi:hypothetical protein